MTLSALPSVFFSTDKDVDVVAAPLVSLSLVVALVVVVVLSRLLTAAAGDDGAAAAPPVVLISAAWVDAEQPILLFLCLRFFSFLNDVSL